jgi:hypothetical protein
MQKSIDHKMLSDKILALSELIDELEKMSGNLENHLYGENKEFWRLLFVQTLYSEVEAQILLIKLSALQRCSNENIPLSQGEILHLQGITYQLTDSGEIKTRESKTSLVAEMKFALKCMAKSFRISHKPDLLHPSYQKLDKFIKIRNRIVHPKKRDDLKIFDKDLDDCFLAWKWLNDDIIAQYQSFSEIMEKKILELRNRLQTLGDA